MSRQIPVTARPWPPDLTDLLARTGEGNRAAFADLYRAISPQLFALSLRMMKRRDIAEEVLQEVFVTIWRKAGAFDPARGSPLTWMASIARNRCLDRLRAFRPEISLEDESSMREWADTAPGPLDQALRSADGRALKHCLDRLEPGARTAIMRIYFEGLTHAELSERTATPLGTVKSWVRRGLMRLKDCLDG